MYGIIKEIFFKRERGGGGVILCAFDLEIMKIILGIGNPKFLMKL